MCTHGVHRAGFQSLNVVGLFPIFVFEHDVCVSQPANFRPWVDFDRPDADFVKKLALADFGILDFQMVHRQISSRF